MKFGPRKPSLKKSIRARTTGKLKRKVKKSINPFYGKKGMGYIRNPKKALYNKVYNKTSFDMLKNAKKPKKSTQTQNKTSYQNNIIPKTGKRKKKVIIKYIFGILFLISGIQLIFENFLAAIFGIILGVILINWGYTSKNYNESEIIELEKEEILNNPEETKQTTQTPSYVKEFLEKTEIEAENIKKESELPFDETKYNEYIKILTNGENLTDEEWEEYAVLGAKKMEIEHQKSSNPKFHRSESEKKLKNAFLNKHYDQINSYEDKIYGDKSIEEIERLKSQIEAFDEFKKFANSKGKGGKLYFVDMWENNHNSQKECFSFRDTLEENLKKATQLKELPEIIITHIKDKNQIVQRDIYKDFPKYKKPLI